MIDIDDESRKAIIEEFQKFAGQDDVITVEGPTPIKNSETGDSLVRVRWVKMIFMPVVVDGRGKPDDFNPDNWRKWAREAAEEGRQAWKLLG